ncbi:hypothetical protein MUN82_10065 [Hymenobacter aerilatus]|uniref:Uncharacterized protein n=1 Tax=Hymenobacter aerilatus TaxID=2932251 RepID=A0A8T9T2L7_9BACT|nr:hypothetical protein [Hymenobacter aerilatus]UOR07424.1 hypothetical protein MUN82_10065 [Hymenobacter aerilatus]
MSFNPYDFYFSYGLYQKTPFNEENFEDLFNLVFSGKRQDLYCPYCQRETVFSPNPRREKKDNSPYAPSSDIYTFSDFKEKFDFRYFHNGKRFEISYKCTREQYLDHIIYFQMIITDSAIMKIGQYPSIADLGAQDIKIYESVLPKNYYRELSKAIGLFSHGIGIGSFVYMRRIFEQLIFDTYDEYKSDINIEYEDFKKMKMNNKIEILNSFLPKSLVERKALYGVLSKGIHELDEDICRDSFPIIRAGIEFILDEKIRQIEQKRKEEKFNKDFASLIKKLS